MRFNRRKGYQRNNNISEEINTFQYYCNFKSYKLRNARIKKILRELNLMKNLSILNAKRIIIKIGSSLLFSNNKFNSKWLDTFIEDVMFLRKKNIDKWDLKYCIQ